MFISPQLLSVQRKRAAAAAFSPSSLSPVFWIEAATSTLYQSNAGSGTQATANADPIGYVTDLSGNGNDISSVANDTTRPTLGGVGSKPYISFASASSQVLRRLSSLGLYANGSCSIFVASNSNPATSGRMISEGNTGASNQIGAWVQASVTTASDSYVFIRDDAGTVAIQSILSTSAFPSSNTVYGIVWDGVNVQGYLAGSASGSSHALGTTSTLTINDFAVGALVRTTIANYWNGNIQGIVIVKRALNSTEITNLSTYLAGLQ